MSKEMKLWDSAEACFCTSPGYFQKTNKPNGLYMYEMDVDNPSFPNDWGIYGVIDGRVVSVGIKFPFRYQIMEHMNGNTMEEFVSLFKLLASNYLSSRTEQPNLDDLLDTRFILV